MAPKKGAKTLAKAASSAAAILENALAPATHAAPTGMFFLCVCRVCLIGWCLAGGDAKPKKKGNGGGGGRRKRVETYSSYIYKVLKQVHPDTGISKRGMRSVCS